MDSRWVFGLCDDTDTRKLCMKSLKKRLYWILLYTLMSAQSGYTYNTVNHRKDFLIQLHNHKERSLKEVKNMCGTSFDLSRYITFKLCII